MHPIRWISFLCLVLLPWLAVPAQACVLARVAGAGQAMPAGDPDPGLLDAAVRAEINFARCRAGLGPLAPVPELVRVARDHSRWMARTGDFSHDGGPPGQRSLSARLRRSGIGYRAGAENIATSHRFRLDGIEVIPGPGRCVFRDRAGRRVPVQSYASLAAEVTARWLASPGHRRNILDPRMRALGTGGAFVERSALCGMFYLTQDFVG